MDELKKIARTLPTLPGVYKYFSAKGDLLYVGKAKNLRKRVQSYFTAKKASYKTHELVQRIAKIEFTIVDTEQDAFLLEDSLIKKFQPKYNIMLKDDKSYPFIVIKKEPFPRVFFTRRKIKDGSEYLGPYTSLTRIRELMNLISLTIPLRNCSLNLSDENIAKKKFKVCLEYHLGNCKGPCEALQTKENYYEALQRMKSFLKGNWQPIIQDFKNEMKIFADALEFEKAEQLRKKLEYLKQYQSKSIIVNPKLGDMDVFSLMKKENFAYINFLMVRQGTIVQTHTSEVEAKLDEGENKILSYGIMQMRERFNSDAEEIIVSQKIFLADKAIKITIPLSGEKKKLLELSQKNAGYFADEMKRKSLEKSLQLTADQLLSGLQMDLKLMQYPSHIECFDNSNFQGSYPVAAMVCFKNAEPSKKDYRHFTIKTVEGINDFASMYEIVYRRYKRLLDENQPLPQLVIIDGGKGQLGAAQEAIEKLNLVGSMTLVGLAKNVEEIFFVNDKESLKLPYHSDSLKFIRRIRDAVHDFGISFHRQKRSAGVFKNELENIEGIGKLTAELLLKKFRSVKAVKAASVEDLEKVVGRAKTRLVKKYFETNAEM